MKLSKTSTKAPEVPCEKTTRGDYYTATKQELIAAGICRAEWFPAKLIRQVKRDGTPYMGNNGRQRTKRVYTVEGRSPAITLTHRRSPDGVEYWIVHVEITEEESRRRYQEHEREEKERIRRVHEELEQRKRENQARQQRAAVDQTPGSDAPIEARAVFEVGDKAVIWAPGCKGHLEPVTILQGYGRHTVDVGDGKNAELWGYMVDGGFVPPHELREYAHRPFHLRLAFAAEAAA